MNFDNLPQQGDKVRSTRDKRIFGVVIKRHPQIMDGKLDDWLIDVRNEHGQFFTCWSVEM